MKQFNYTFDELYDCILLSLHNSDGTANIKTIISTIIDKLELSDGEINDIHRGNRTKLSYRTQWGLNYLKNYGLIRNIKRGVWSLTKRGEKITNVDKDVVNKRVRKVNLLRKILPGMRDGIIFIENNYIVAEYENRNMRLLDLAEKLSSRIDYLFILYDYKGNILSDDLKVLQKIKELEGDEIFIDNDLLIISDEPFKYNSSKYQNINEIITEKELLVDENLLVDEDLDKELLTDEEIEEFVDPTQIKIFYSQNKIDSFEDNSIYLFQDNIYSKNNSMPWDDFGYKIMFEAFFYKNKEIKELGFLKILIKGESNTSTYFEQNCEKLNTGVYDITDFMKPNKFVSLGTDIDYYEKLNSLFINNSRIILDLLCDVSFNQNKRTIYSTWEGFETALMRGKSSESRLKKGYSIALGKYNILENFRISLNDIDSFEPIEFFFENNSFFKKTNINILVGNNGTGKTTILKEIIDIVTGIKEISDKWTYFNKLIVVAFSPFENFYTTNQLEKKLHEQNIKKINTSKKKQIKTINKYEQKTNYSYIGFRNERNKFDLNLPKRNILKSILKIINYDNENNWWLSKSRLDILLETLSLAISFDYIKLYKKDGTFINLLSNKRKKYSHEQISQNKDSLKNLVKSQFDSNKEIEFYFNDEKIDLSSGQLIYSYMLPAIVSEIENESLLVLDEPELYLHPSIEIGLIEMLNYLLEETTSYAIIATHSSVIVREVNRKGVHILKRKDKKYTEILEPSIQTYGESIDEITGEVFDDYYIEKPYQKKLDDFFNNNVEKKLDLVKDKIGDDALSHVLSKDINDDDFIYEADNGIS